MKDLWIPYIRALNSQNIDYTKNPDLFFNICHNESNHHTPRKKVRPWE